MKNLQNQHVVASTYPCVNTLKKETAMSMCRKIVFTVYFTVLSLILSVSSVYSEISELDIDELDNIPVSTSFQDVIACRLGKNGEHVVRILRRLDILGSDYIYYIQQDSGKIRLYRDFFDDEDENKDSVRNRELASTLEFAFLSCQGKGENIFVMTAPPMAGRLLGASFVRYNSDSEEWESFGMGVMEHPVFVYVNRNEILGIAKLSPQDRHCCPNHIYQMQGYVAQKGEKFDDGSEPITKLPSKKGYRVTPLSVQIELSGTDAPKYFDKSLKPGSTP